MRRVGHRQQRRGEYAHPQCTKAVGGGGNGAAAPAELDFGEVREEAEAENGLKKVDGVARVC